MSEDREGLVSTSSSRVVVSTPYFPYYSITGNYEHLQVIIK